MGKLATINPSISEVIQSSSISKTTAAIFILLAGTGYWIAFSTTWGGAAILVAIPCILILAKLPTARQAFYGGYAAGLAAYVPHLWFFVHVFTWRAPFVWLIAGWPMAAVVLLLHFARRRFGPHWAIWLTPMLWTGVEYFRSEVYLLRFAWIIPGQAAAFLPGVQWERLGVYGLGFVYVLAAALMFGNSKSLRIVGVAATIIFAFLMYSPPLPKISGDANLHVAGVQLEFPTDTQAAQALDKLAAEHPEAQILVLSEYSFEGPIPQVVRDVIKKNGRYLVAGGIEYVANGFYDTAYVIGPDGRDVFQQGKSVPVQFMGDGLPAKKRRAWDSPWGKIGIVVCYDVSYGTVMDDFIREGAQGFVIPTMDLQSWGEYERRMLHGRLAPVRSAEYGVPIFSLWSSGESQLTDRFGRVIAHGSYPGQGDEIAGPFNLTPSRGIPPDRLLAKAAMLGTGSFVLFLMIAAWRRRKQNGKRKALDVHAAPPGIF